MNLSPFCTKDEVLEYLTEKIKRDAFAYVLRLNGNAWIATKELIAEGKLTLIESNETPLPHRPDDSQS